MMSGTIQWRRAGKYWIESGNGDRNVNEWVAFLTRKRFGLPLFFLVGRNRAEAESGVIEYLRTSGKGKV